jgi:hypothetical protein
MVLHSDFLEGHVPVVKLVLDADGWVEGNGHIQKLKRSVGQKFEYKAFGKFIGHLYSEGPVRAVGGSDCSRNVAFRIDVFEDDIMSEAHLLLSFTESVQGYLAMLISNCFFSDSARARSI